VIRVWRAAVLLVAAGLAFVGAAAGGGRAAWLVFGSAAGLAVFGIAAGLRAGVAHVDYHGSLSYTWTDPTLFL